MRTGSLGPPSRKNKPEPGNADRARWGKLAMTSFAKATGANRDLPSDPETVLADLLADVMHWCDARKTADQSLEPIDFESALDRARAHHAKERTDQKKHVRR
jgi:hypothetical protein